MQIIWGLPFCFEIHAWLTQPFKYIQRLCIKKLLGCFYGMFCVVIHLYYQASQFFSIWLNMSRKYLLIILVQVNLVVILCRLSLICPFSCCVITSVLHPINPLYFLSSRHYQNSIILRCVKQLSNFLWWQYTQFLVSRTVMELMAQSSVAYL